MEMRRKVTQRSGRAARCAVWYVRAKVKLGFVMVMCCDVLQCHGEVGSGAVSQRRCGVPCCNGNVRRGEA
jgi:hypothetical protein